MGKHDTFNLACTSKYYEDMGYFGHPNCSDNLTNSMNKYGVEKPITPQNLGPDAHEQIMLWGLTKAKKFND